MIDRERLQTIGLAPEHAERAVPALAAGQCSPAAALWKQHVGGELRVCLNAMETLHRHWGSGDGQKGSEESN